MSRKPIKSKRLNLQNKVLYFLLLSFLILTPHAYAKVPRLILAGSTTMLPLSEHLATNYRKRVMADVLVQGGGSSAGVNAVLNNVAQIAASSRKLTKEEQEKLKPIVVARDALAIVVHSSNPIKNITLDELRDVLSGKTKNWKELGVPFDKAIQLVNDSTGAGTRAAMEELVMGKSKEHGIKGTPITLMSVVVNSSSEMKANIANFKYAIGYLPFSYLDNTVKAEPINNVLPSYAATYRDKYPLFRDLYYAIKKDASGLELAYIYYVLSPEGQDIVVQEGFLPIKLITSVEELFKIMAGQ